MLNIKDFLKKQKSLMDPWNFKHEKYNINKKDYFLLSEILRLKSSFFEKLLSGKFNNDKNILIKDYDNKLIENKYISAFFGKTIYNSNINMLFFNDMLKLYIISDFLQFKDQKEYYMGELSQRLKNYSFKGFFFKKENGSILLESQGKNARELISYQAHLGSHIEISFNEYTILKDLLPKYKNILLSLISINEDLSQIKNKLDIKDVSIFEKIYSYISLTARV